MAVKVSNLYAALINNNGNTFYQQNNFYNFRIFIFEVIDFYSLFIVLVIVFSLQVKFFNQHITNEGFLHSREKRNLLITTVVFSTCILYRAVFNSLKIFDDVNGSSEIEELEG